MNLVIRAQTLNDQPLSQAIVCSFDVKGGTIGRSDTNTMTLPDPERHISRLQAEVSAQAGGHFSIRNAGAANAIFINGRALAPGEGSALAHGDELRIGGYALGVQVESDDDTLRTIVGSRPVVDARDVIVRSAAEVRTDHGKPGRRHKAPMPEIAPVEPVAWAAPPTPAAPPAPPRPDSTVPTWAGLNPFADLLGTGAAASPPGAIDPFAMLGVPGPAPAPMSMPAPTARPSAGAPARLPDDFDPFADLNPPAAAPAPGAAMPRPAGAHDLLGSVGIGAGSAPSLDASFGLGGSSGGSSADPLAAFMSNTPAPGAARAMAGSAQASTDPFAMFGPTPGQAAADSPPGPAAFNHTPELKAAYEPPPLVGAKKPVAPPVAPPPFASHVAPHVAPPAASIVASPDVTARRVPASSAHTSDALWAAFCEGSGVPMQLPQGLTPDQMRLLGTIMRKAVEGTLGLMAVRATAKTELHAAVTTIRSRNNNPLKFSPGVEVALSQLLQPPLRGFMTGPAAMQDAMHDLIGHSIGTMAGMRAALAGVLSRFEPAQLEGKLATKSVLDSLMPGSRKAKLWDLYLQHFESIRNDAQDDFHTFFGAAFVAAYEAQLDQLQPAGD